LEVVEIPNQLHFLIHIIIVLVNDLIWKQYLSYEKWLQAAQQFALFFPSPCLHVLLAL